MKSMTAYAYRELNREGAVISAEIKAYNSRFLDLTVHMPPLLSSLESEIRKYLGSRFLRGKMDVYIKVKEDNPAVTVTINETAALSYIKAIRDLAKTLVMDENPGLDTILHLDGVLEIDKVRDSEKYRAQINWVLAEASDMLDRERTSEGEHTREDILSHLDILEVSLEAVSSRAPEIEEQIKENLRSRFAELLGERIDESRILSETAVLLVKQSISEEISRLSSHLKEFRQEIERGRNDTNTGLGKKLDFLSQEINREVNTIGSKTSMFEVSLEVVRMKNALENIREQLRNVE